MDENESFRFVLGVRVRPVGTGAGAGSFGIDRLAVVLDALAKAGPRRLIAGELSVFNA